MCIFTVKGILVNAEIFLFAVHPE